MKTKEKKIAHAVRKGIFEILRFILYVVLLLVGRVLRPIANVATTVGLIIFLFCVIFRRDMVTPMWAGLALAVSALVVTVLYETLLALVAPAGVVIVSDV